MSRDKNKRARAEVEPKVMFIEDLLRQVRGGQLRVPRFQRPFVWTNERMLRLLTSIRNKYPIGSLLIWETRQPCASVAKVGPLQVRTDDAPEGTTVGYLLDGHQRLSTLLGALQLGDDVADEAEYKWRIYYDLDNEEFTHLRVTPGQNHFPMWKLLDTVAFLAQAEQIMKDSGKKQGKAYVERARELARVFTKYQVPVTLIKNADLSEAIEIFTLLNTSGRRMTPDQILTALTYKESGFNLAAAIDQIIERRLRPAHYETVSRNALVRVILAALGENIYSTFEDWRKLAEQHRRNLGTTVRQCEVSLASAVAFLHADIGASSSKALPYALQLVLLSEFFRVCREPTERQREVLRRWIWVTSFSGAYMVGSSKRFNEAVSAALALARGDEGPAVQAIAASALPLPVHFSQRSARVRAFHLFLKSLEPRNLETGRPIPRGTLLAGGLADAVAVVQEGDETMRRRLANRVLVGVESGSDVLTSLRALEAKPAENRTEILRSHAIPEEAWRCLLNGDDAGFIDRRHTHLVEREREFIQSKGVKLPEDATTEVDESEVEEDEIDEIT